MNQVTDAGTMGSKHYVPQVDGNKTGSTQLDSRKGHSQTIQHSSASSKSHPQHAKVPEPLRPSGKPSAAPDEPKQHQPSHGADKIPSGVSLSPKVKDAGLP